MLSMHTIFNFIFAHIAFGAIHELCHLFVALLCGCRPALTLNNCSGALLKRCVCIPAARAGWRQAVVRHAGWIGSMFAVIATIWMRFEFTVFCVAIITALEAVMSDMFMLQPFASKEGRFFCGNFGMVLLESAWTHGKTAKDILETMVKVTMMRGAQSGGVVTYVQAKRGNGNDLRGLRGRVVNSKRTDLSKLVRSKIDSVERWAPLKSGVRLYAGHTRFATSSKATFDGTHPHQWSPPCSLYVHIGFGSGSLKHQRRNVECFICHNGDLDFFDVCGRTYDLGTIQEWLVRATGHPMPSSVDSCAVAGLMDLIRTQGSWFLSVRFGYLFGLKRNSLDYAMPKQASFKELGAICESVFAKHLQQAGNSVEALVKLTQAMSDDIKESARSNRATLGCDGKDFAVLISAAIDAFFDNDLFAAAKFFLANAKGSFGLCVTHSLDADRQMVLAARGQTISVAFYPKIGLILYGSEQAAVKAAVGVRTPAVTATKFSKKDGLDGPAVRIDLDDLGGELCLLDWGEGKASASRKNLSVPLHNMMGGKVTMTLSQESPHKLGKLTKRLVPLEDNPLVLPLPPDVCEPVAADINGIPKALARLHDDWNSGNSLNRITAWCLGRQLKQRLTQKDEGRIPSDAVDLLITGCEVSMWLGEQFAADLNMAFKKLIVRPIAANKVLGLLGQDFTMPQLGFGFSENSWDLTDAIVLIISHSGGTFPSLAVSNLLQAVTSNIFVLTSEWDTQIGKQLRQMTSKGSFQSRIFSTEIGVRPAEPCSISVAATHYLLTLIFQYIAMVISGDRNLRRLAGSIIKDRDLSELERCARDSIHALEEIVGTDREGKKLRASTETELRNKGAFWAQHVLETPRSWIVCVVYITITVSTGCPLMTGVYRALESCLRDSDDNDEDDFPNVYLTHLATFLDVLIYIFLPQLSILLIRLLQGRRLLHRMVGRSVVIGDCPWVAQCADAFLSKLFASSYSAAGVTVLSGNPCDHLVHRMTHRVVRGGLLAVGRPDGRLTALTSIESAVCLSVNQASSIQSIGSTCESLTIGHNPFKLPLSEHAVFLKGQRPDYLCERLLRESNLAGDGSSCSHSKTRESDLPALKSMSAGALLGAYSNLRGKESEPQTPYQRLQIMVNEKARVAEEEKRMEDCFSRLDADGSGALGFEEFVSACQELGKDLPLSSLRKLFDDADMDGSGTLDFEESKKIITLDYAKLLQLLDVSNAGASPSLLVKPSVEQYFGEELRHALPAGTHEYQIVESQELSMRLYETRFASLERAVAFFVLFHELGNCVANFWPRVSLGFLGYRIDRTHSIMRIATTACPVSGSEVRDMMKKLSSEKAWQALGNMMTLAQTHWLDSRGVPRMSYELRRSQQARDSLKGCSRHTSNIERMSTASTQVIDSSDGKQTVSIMNAEECVLKTMEPQNAAPEACKLLQKRSDLHTNSVLRNAVIGDMGERNIKLESAVNIEHVGIFQQADLKADGVAQEGASPAILCGAQYECLGPPPPIRKTPPSSQVVICCTTPKPACINLAMHTNLHTRACNRLKQV